MKQNNIWKTWEICWIIFATLIILATSLYWKDNLVGIIAALTGIWCVILTGKGKISSFYFGTINTILYAVVAWKARYWGEVMLNLIYYLPTTKLLEKPLLFYKKFYTAIKIAKFF